MNKQGFYEAPASSIWFLDTAEEEIAEQRLCNSAPEMDLDNHFDLDTPTSDLVWRDETGQDEVDPDSIGWEDRVDDRVAYFQNRDCVFRCQSMESLRALTVSLSEEELEPQDEYPGLWWCIEKRETQLREIEQKEQARLDAIAAERNRKIAKGIIKPFEPDDAYWEEQDYAREAHLQAEFERKHPPMKRIPDAPFVPVLMQMGSTRVRVEDKAEYEIKLKKGFEVYDPKKAH